MGAKHKGRAGPPILLVTAVTRGVLAITAPGHRPLALAQRLLSPKSVLGRRKEGFLEEEVLVCFSPAGAPSWEGRDSVCIGANLQHKRAIQLWLICTKAFKEALALTRGILKMLKGEGRRRLGGRVAAHCWEMWVAWCLLLIVPPSWSLRCLGQPHLCPMDTGAGAGHLWVTQALFNLPVPVGKAQR